MFFVVVALPSLIYIFVVIVPPWLMSLYVVVAPPWLIYIFVVIVPPWLMSLYVVVDYDVHVWCTLLWCTLRCTKHIAWTLLKTCGCSVGLTTLGLSSRPSPAQVCEPLGQLMRYIPFDTSKHNLIWSWQFSSFRTARNLEKLCNNSWLVVRTLWNSWKFHVITFTKKTTKCTITL